VLTWFDRQRKLDDEDLDSGDDEGRADRAAAAPEVMVEDQTYNFMDADLARHAIPEPSDGELYLLKIPQFLAIEPTAFHHKTFRPPVTDHHSKAPPSDHFSAFATAVTTIRWRRSPSDHTKLQSNARILRWSDGSLTLQHANDPLNQYEINANVLAPPQVNPRVPTPTMDMRKQKNQASKESYTYLVAPYEEANVMRVTNKFTTGLSIVPTTSTKDAALEKLQNDLAMAASRGRDNADQAISFIDVNEDPELRRQREEQQYKEKLKQQRARDKHAMREQEKSSRGMNRGHRSGYGGGLDIDMLEGEGGGRKSGPKKPRAKSSRHQDWSDDDGEPGYRARPSKEDDYEDDGFIVASDEDEEIVEDDDDDDDGIVEEPRRGKDRNSPKRNRREDNDEDDTDDDAEVVVRAKKRRVIQDESDEEE
jgi:RNA polymerase-associated protein LEO1